VTDRRRFSSSSLALFVAIGVGVSAPSVASADAGQACVKAFEKGNDLRDGGALRAARAQFVACAADACPKAMRVDCARWLDEVDAALPSIVVGAKDAQGTDLFDITVRVDGETIENIQAGRPVVLDPGPHIVHFERTRGSEIELQDVKVILRTGERNRSVIGTLGAPTKSETPVQPKNDGAGGGNVPVAAWVFGGIGVVALGSFATFAILGTNEKSRLTLACSPACTDADVSTLRTDYLVADISLGVGIVALGLATYFLLTNKSSSAPAAFTPQRFARTIWK
jgi:hypothetical protein